MKNTFNILTHWGNANQNYIEIQLHATQKGYHQKTDTTNADKDADKRESCTLLVGI
jgi:hypothetical protein